MTARRSPLQWLSLLLFPPRCICGEVIPIGKALCNDCVELLPDALAKLPRCGFCGKPRPSCVCKLHPPVYTRCLSALLYTPDTKPLFARLKEGCPDCADTLAHLMVARWREEGLEEIDAVYFVPAKAGRYNQAEALAIRVSEQLLLSLPKQVLVRQQNSRVQHTLSSEERRENAKMSYQAIEGSVVPKRILLIDDIATTGATLNRCTSLLLDCGAKEVFCLTAATTPLHPVGAFEIGRENLPHALS